MANAPNRKKMIYVLIAIIVAIAMVLVIWLSPAPFVLWNASRSVPIGWYYVEHRKPKVGEIAVVKLEDWPELYASERGYLPSNVWLLKPVAAEFPAVVCRFGRYVLIDGKLVAQARIWDSRKRLLPVWKSCLTLKSDEVFVLAKPKNSFDSRYFGPIKHRGIIGTAHLIWK